MKHKVINDQYELIKQIGSGASAIVWLAKDLKNNRDVALKIEKEMTGEKGELSNNSKRFRLEADTLMKFDHPNIIKVYEVFSVKGRLVIVMEYLEGETLDSKIRGRSKISIEDSLIYLEQLLEALREIHRENIIHRDLKPQNIYLTVTNKIKLMDFGIVQESIDQELTRQGNVIGTVEYMAPEILGKKVKANPTSEIHSLGVLMYKLLTNTFPYEVNYSNQKETALNILKEERDLINLHNKDVDIHLTKIINKMIEIEPIDRFKNADEVLEALEEYANTPIKRRRSSPSGEQNFPQKQKLILGILVVLIFVLLTVTLIITLNN